jgi:hypothetical protein
MKKTNVVLGFGRLSVAGKIEKARSIVTGMTGNAHFPTPIPALDTVTAQINELETAQLAALSGGPEDTANMHVKRQALELSLRALATYVETVANSNPAEAEAIVLSAGLTVKVRTLPKTMDFEAATTRNPGEIAVSKRHENRAFFIVQMTTTPEEESSWTTIHSGTRGRVVKSGLRSGLRYHFRASVLDKNGQRPWSEVKSALAL